jgi:hypothetical protein
VTDLPIFRPTAEAVCRNEDPELWFPTETSDEAYAVTLCAQCGDLRACRAWILHTEWAMGGTVSVVHGVVGGLRPAERLSRYRARKRSRTVVQ